MEAAISLMEIGYKDQIVDFFNQNKKDLGSDILKNHLLIRKLFLYDNIKRTSRRMGYDQSISIKEASFIFILLAAISFSLY